MKGMLVGGIDAPQAPWTKTTAADLKSGLEWEEERKKEREREREQIKVVREWDEGGTYNNNLEGHWNATIIGLL